jgi:hypothetical protein
VLHAQPELLLNLTYFSMKGSIKTLYPARLFERRQGSRATVDTAVAVSVSLPRMPLSLLSHLAVMPLYCPFGLLFCLNGPLYCLTASPCYSSSTSVPQSLQLLPRIITSFETLCKALSGAEHLTLCPLGAPTLLAY